MTFFKCYAKSGGYQPVAKHNPTGYDITFNDRD